MAGAYSPRALAHASVSTPIAWEELRDADPTTFTILTMPERLRTDRRPVGVDGRASPASIAPLLAWWERDLENGAR